MYVKKIEKESKLIFFFYSRTAIYAQPYIRAGVNRIQIEHHISADLSNQETRNDFDAFLYVYTYSMSISPLFDVF